MRIILTDKRLYFRFGWHEDKHQCFICRKIRGLLQLNGAYNWFRNVINIGEDTIVVKKTSKLYMLFRMRCLNLSVHRITATVVLLKCFIK